MNQETRTCVEFLLLKVTGQSWTEPSPVTNTPGGGGGSSTVKVPGDVPPARVCFFKPSSLAKAVAEIQLFEWRGKGHQFSESEKCFWFTYLLEDLT